MALNIIILHFYIRLHKKLKNKKLCISSNSFYPSPIYSPLNIQIKSYGIAQHTARPMYIFLEPNEQQVNFFVKNECQALCSPLYINILQLLPLFAATAPAKLIQTKYIQFT